MAHRWYEAGHPPFASLYEMLLSFVWTLAALTLVAEKKYAVKVIGTVTMAQTFIRHGSKSSTTKMRYGDVGSEFRGGVVLTGIALRCRLSR